MLINKQDVCIGIKKMLLCSELLTVLSGLLRRRTSKTYDYINFSFPEAIFSENTNKKNYSIVFHHFMVWLSLFVLMFWSSLLISQVFKNIMNHKLMS